MILKQFILLSLLINPIFQLNLTNLNQRVKNIFSFVQINNQINIFGPSLLRDYIPEIPELNGTITILDLPAPDSQPQVNPEPARPASSNQDEYLTIKVKPNQGPQSFAILMNFQSDGTSSYQFINQDCKLMAAMSGMCSIGEIYNPVLNVCQQIFCMEGYTFTSHGCVSIESNQTAIDSQPIKNPPEEIQIELTVLHKFCLNLVGFNDTLNCSHHLILKSDSFLNNFKDSLSKVLGISRDRIDNLTIISHDRQSDQITINKNESITDLTDDKPLPKTYVVKSEKTRLSFILKDYKKFSDEKMETIVLFYTLSNMAIEYTPLKISDHHVILSGVSEIETKNDSWCNTNGDWKLSVRNDFRILASFDKNEKPTYFIYLNQTETLYKTGDFYLTVAYAPTSSPDLNISIYNKNYHDQLLNMNAFRRKRNAEKHNEYVKLSSLNWDLESNQLLSDDEISKLKQVNKTFMSLTDVTEYIFDNNVTEVFTQKFLTVCQRNPKIRTKCLNLETIRVRLCELEYQEKNRSQCSRLLNECYSINQYEYDNLMPKEYIRICKYKNREDLNKSIDFNKKLEHVRKSEEILNKVQGYFSLLSNLASLIFLLATLLTYVLFKELRNLPAWNIINLTVALIIAQGSFLVGSFVNSNRIICFIESIFAHYGFLAAFFWMNIIAFDLHRNFRKKSSHIILHFVTLKERLPKYLLYGWLSPLLIVLISIIIDLTVKLPMDDSYFKPCYAGFLEGCDNIRKMKLKDNIIDNKNLVYNKTSLKQSKFNETSLIEPCYTNTPQVILVEILTSSCWIQNGKLISLNLILTYY